MNACKATRSKTCRNTTFTWLKHARQSTKSRDIIGSHSRDSYADNVTVNRYNGHITDTNLHVWPSNICQWALQMLCVKLCKLNYAAQCLFVTGTGTKKCWKLESYSLYLQSTVWAQEVYEIRYLIINSIPCSHWWYGDDWEWTKEQTVVFAGEYGQSMRSNG